MLHGPEFCGDDFPANQSFNFVLWHNEMQQENQDKFPLEENKVDPALLY